MPTKRGPGHPQKRLRMQDPVNTWYEAVEQEHDNTLEAFDAYVAYCIVHYTSEKATDATLQLGKRS